MYGTRYGFPYKSFPGAPGNLYRYIDAHSGQRYESLDLITRASYELRKPLKKPDLIGLSVHDFEGAKHVKEQKGRVYFAPCVKELNLDLNILEIAEGEDRTGLEAFLAAASRECTSLRIQTSQQSVSQLFGLPFSSLTELALLTA